MKHIKTSFGSFAALKYLDLPLVLYQRKAPSANHGTNIILNGTPKGITMKLILFKLSGQFLNVTINYYTSHFVPKWNTEESNLLTYKTGGNLQFLHKNSILLITPLFFIELELALFFDY